MCGLAGIYSFSDVDPQALAALVRRMTDLIAHRGPDDSGHEIMGRAALGHRRLSIIDLSPSGHQPMANDDGSIVIVYNGECYNYKEIAARLKAEGVVFRSTSDTEVILRLYEHRGEKGFAELDGMFAFALYDRRRDVMLLVRDRFGIKPLYYHADRERVVFASELKSLLADGRTPTAINRAALSDYLHLLSIPDPHSIFQDVKRLEPGHVLKITRRGVEDTTYWRLPIKIDEAMSYEDAVAGFSKRFDAAMARHMVSDVPVGAFLSGGVDSSAIVARAGESAGHPLETFSVVFTGLEEFDESPYAEKVARHCGTRHRNFALTPNLVDALPKVAWHADEPFAVSSAFALYFISKVAREHVKVVLSGDGGDEVFGGYLWRHFDFPAIPQAAATGLGRLARIIDGSAQATRMLPERLVRKIRSVGESDRRYLNAFINFTDKDIADLLEPDVAEDLVGHWATNSVQRHLDDAPTSEQLAAKLYCDIKSTLVSEMLTKADRMTMAHGLEGRVPFLDHHLVEWAFTVPGRHKIAMQNGALSGKALVKTAMEPHLPHDILYRRKQGFNVPLKVWMRGELRSFVRDSLAAETVKKRGYFKPEAVTRLLDGHEAGQFDASNKIFTIMMLEVWHQQVLDRRSSLAAGSPIQA